MSIFGVTHLNFSHFNLGTARPVGTGTYRVGRPHCGGRRMQFRIVGSGASGSDNPYGGYNSDLTRWAGGAAAGDPIQNPLSDFPNPGDLGPNVDEFLKSSYCTSDG